MIEACAELDDQATEDYLNGKEISNETIKKLLRKAVVTCAFFPVLCGSAFKNKGVQPLLDAVVDYLPSPLERPPIKGIDVKTGAEIVRRASDNEPLSMLAFKLMDDQYGVLTFCRIYSGKLDKGMAAPQFDAGEDRNGSGAWCSCMPTPARRFPKPMPGISWRWSG